MAKTNKPLVSDPPYFYTLGFRLAQVYGLKEQPTLPSRPGLLSWFAAHKQIEQVEVYADSLVVRIEDGTTHRLIIQQN